jgi:hypothetical protein
MTTKIMSHIKFTTKDGFDDMFLEAAEAFNKKIMTDFEWYITKIDENIYMATNIYADLDQVMDIQDAELQWLDEIEHMLVLTDDGSRTVADSGPIV